MAGRPAGSRGGGADKGAASEGQPSPSRHPRRGRRGGTQRRTFLRSYQQVGVLAALPGGDGPRSALSLLPPLKINSGTGLGRPAPAISGATEASPPWTSKRGVWGDEGIVKFLDSQELSDVALVRPAKKIYEAPAERWAGLAGGPRTRLIFDFHLIIFSLPSTPCPERRTKRRVGDGRQAPDPPIRLDPHNAQRLVLL